MNEQLLYHIAITSIPYIGDVTAKKLIAYCGSSGQVFEEKKSVLEKIPGIGPLNANKIIHHKTEAIAQAEEEIEFIKKNDITPLFFLDENYPKRLLNCEDGPVLIYSKGKVNYNNNKIVSIVGTRKATEYGKDFCENLIKNLAPHKPLIVSGLAYGVDICAHKSSVKYNLPTVGVLAHGLDRLYPSQHQSVANQMIQNGGLLSDFKSGTKPDRENFPKRNRIVAGLADLTLVIESSKKGGSLITANIAKDYKRDVFALPGRVGDTQSEGCNNLIKNNNATLIQSVKDIETFMGWELKKQTKELQTQLFIELTHEQKILTSILSKQNSVGIDELSLLSKMPMSQTTSLLLNLEFDGVVKSLPGKLYKLV